MKQKRRIRVLIKNAFCRRQRNASTADKLAFAYMVPIYVFAFVKDPKIK